MLEKQEFRYHRAQCRNKKHDTGKYQRFFPAPIRSHITRNSTADNAANERAGTCKAVPSIRIYKIFRSQEECLQSFFRTRNDCCIISEQQPSQHGYKHNRKKISFTSFFGVIHDIKTNKVKNEEQKK